MTYNKFLEIILERRAECVESIEQYLTVLVEHATNIMATGLLTTWHRTIAKEKVEIDKKKKCAFLTNKDTISKFTQEYLLKTKSIHLKKLVERLKKKNIKQIREVDYSELIDLVVLVINDDELNEDAVVFLFKKYLKDDAILY